MKRNVAIVGILVVLALIAFSLWRGAGAAEVAGIEGEQVRVERGTMTAVINATGNVEANRQVSLSFRSTGRVSEIAVEEGEHVAEGDVLARLETTDLEFAVAQAESNVAIQEARIRQLEAPPSEQEIQAAEAQLASAQESLARLQAGPDPEEIRAAEAQLASAQESLARLQSGPSAADIRAAEAQLASARENLAQLQQGPDPDDVAAAQANLAAAQAALAELEAGPDEAQLIAAQAELDRAIAALKRAQAAYDQVSYRGDISSLPQSLELEQATINYEQAKANFDNVAAGASPDQIEQARANVVQAQSQLDNLLEGSDSASIRSAQAQVAQAEAALAELQRGANAADIRAAEAQVAQAEEALNQLRNGPDEEEINVARANLRQAELQLLQAENDLEAATLIAPFEGTVANLGANEGELVTSAQPMVTIADLSSFLIEVEVDEIDIGEVEPEDQVTIAVDSLPGVEIPGRIEYISPIPNESQGVVTYPVRIRLNAEEATRLRVGMSANVEIVTEVLEDVLIVPSRAITVDRATGEVYVLKIVDGTPVRVNVETGLRNGDVTQIIAGDVVEGDTLLIRSESSEERLRMQLGGQ